MGGRVYMLTKIATSLLAASMMLLPVTVASAENAPCPQQLRRAGVCSVAGVSDGTGVVLNAESSLAREESSPQGNTQPEIKRPRPLTAAELQAQFDEVCYSAGQCGVRAAAMLNPIIPTKEGADAPAAAGAPARVVTAADVARLLPARGVLHTEPEGWAVVGVPANFWVEVAPMTAIGQLLGQTAEVRFTPTFYRFDYGDGGSRATATPGSSWAELGAEELTATPTGHVYRARGSLHASVAVVYAAEYRVGRGAWIAVNGAVTAEVPAVDVLVVAERTVLTAGNAAG